MADQDYPHGPRPEIKEKSGDETTGQGDSVRSEPLDPRLVTIARAIGRLIARERFREQIGTSRHDDR